MIQLTNCTLGVKQQSLTQSVNMISYIIS